MRTAARLVLPSITSRRGLGPPADEILRAGRASVIRLRSRLLAGSNRSCWEFEPPRSYRAGGSTGDCWSSLLRILAQYHLELSIRPVVTRPVTFFYHDMLDREAGRPTHTFFTDVCVFTGVCVCVFKAQLLPVSFG